MPNISQNPKPGIILACIILGILLLVHAVASGCSSRSPGHSNPDATIWRIGNGQFCCETDWHKEGYVRLDCGEVGRIYVFTTALNTKVPCDAGGE